MLRLQVQFVWAASLTLNCVGSKCVSMVHRLVTLYLATRFMHLWPCTLWHDLCTCDLVPCDTIYALVTLYLTTRFMHLWPCTLWHDLCTCDLVPCDTIYALVTLYLATRFMHLWPCTLRHDLCTCDLVPCDTIYALVTLYLATWFMHLWPCTLRHDLCTCDLVPCDTIYALESAGFLSLTVLLVSMLALQSVAQQCTFQLLLQLWSTPCPQGCRIMLNHSLLLAFLHKRMKTCRDGWSKQIIFFACTLICMISIRRVLTGTWAWFTPQEPCCVQA